MNSHLETASQIQMIDAAIEFRPKATSFSRSDFFVGRWMTGS